MLGLLTLTRIALIKGVELVDFYNEHRKGIRSIAIGKTEVRHKIVRVCFAVSDDGRISCWAILDSDKVALAIET